MTCLRLLAAVKCRQNQKNAPKWSLQAAFWKDQKFSEQGPGNPKIAILGVPDLSAAKRQEAKKRAQAVYGGFEFAGKFWAETGQRCQS